jgi:hypothetical protein
MTTQFPDQLMLRETSYAMVAVAGSGLFDPAQHGEMAELRARLDFAPARPGPGESVTSWIEQTFSLDYGFAWPGRDHPPAAEDPRTSRDT